MYNTQQLLSKERLHSVRFYGPAEKRGEEAMLNWPNLPSLAIFGLLRDAANEAGVTIGIPSVQAVRRLREHQKAADLTRDMQLCVYLEITSRIDDGGFTTFCLKVFVNVYQLTMAQLPVTDLVEVAIA
jgi:hypothetical protein